jgi:hypothetical protein
MLNINRYKIILSEEMYDDVISYKLMSLVDAHDGGRELARLEIKPPDNKKGWLIEPLMKHCDRLNEEYRAYDHELFDYTVERIV